jgi:hypothetical protein
VTVDVTDASEPVSDAESADAVAAPDASVDATTGGDASTPVQRDAGVRDARPDVKPPGPSSDGGMPCDSVTCPPGQACVNEAHGQPLGVCVDTCDCSNCSNCDYTAQDGRWNDMQEYCGNLNSQPATMRCNVPCQGGGQGCIYYGAVNICWPLEGCFSQ